MLYDDDLCKWKKEIVRDFFPNYTDVHFMQKKNPDIKGKKEMTEKMKERETGR